MQVSNRVVRSILTPASMALLAPVMPVGVQRTVMNLLGVLPLPAGVRSGNVVLAGQVVEALQPEGGPVRGHVLYLHGGGYQLGSPASHRGLTSRLARDAQVRVLVVDYPLAPEHQYPVALDQIEEIYRALVAEVGDPGLVVVAGDSAGGGLTAALLLRLAPEEQPAGAWMQSPWLDLTPQPERRDARDPMLRMTWLEKWAGEYAPGRRADLGVSPGLATVEQVAGFPRTLIQYDPTEVLAPQADSFLALLREAGVAVEVSLHPDSWHVPALAAGMTATGDQALEDACTFIAEVVG